MCAVYNKNSNKNVSKTQGNQSRSEYDDESELADNYLDIWQINPSYKDIKPNRIKVKLVSLYILMGIIFFLSILTFSNLMISLLIILSVLTLFIVAFHDNFFKFQNLSSTIFNKITPFDPFKHIQFWILNDDPATILIVNKKSLLTIATRIFKIEILPENVHPTLNHFLKTVNKAQISFSYQVVHKPMLNLFERSNPKMNNNKLKGNNKYNAIGSFDISIYFAVHHTAKGILTNYKTVNLLETVKISSNELKSKFSANFHHTKITLLTDNDLINAIRTLFTKDEINFTQKADDKFKSSKLCPQILLKSSFLIVIGFYISFTLFYLGISWEFIIIIILILIISMVFLWWNDIFFCFLNSYLNRTNQIISVNPFSNVQFFRLRHFRDTIFLYINQKLLIGLRSFNLKTATQPSFSLPGKFFRSLNSKKIPFVYSLHSSAIAPKLFVKECSGSLNDKTKDNLEGIIFHIIDKEQKRKIKHPEIEFHKWLQMRTGIWKTTLTISAFSYKFTTYLGISDFIEIAKELSDSSDIIKDAFEDHFEDTQLVKLRNNLLISGFLTESFKSNLYRKDGTHLNYLYFQGKTLINFIKIVNEFKKGVEVKIAAEFNTPLHLENNIVIGSTINTEFLEEEVPLGFKFEQLNRLLITNFTNEDRELLCMKIVSELVKKSIPSIIFDFSGNWSKLMNYFEDSRYVNEFLYFKLGSSFNVNLLHSEIEYDENNRHYLNYFYDVYAMAFKEQKSNVDALKALILKNQNKSLTSITFDLQYMQKWEKGSYYEDILSFFRDFKQQSIVFSDKLYEYEGKITPSTFIKNDKSVIIDLSILRDLELKVFVMFVVISKLIHYSQNSIDYIEKTLIIPHADLFFDAEYLDNNYTNDYNYGKVDKFLNPLLQKGFGIVLLSNQVRYLHPNVFNYLENIITFKARDKRDIAVLKNQMNLQELHGTGYYSSKRNDTYQIEYLKNMKHEEVLVKRSDIYQPFPGIIDYDSLNEIKLLNYYKIMEYMQQQGYNLKLVEEKLLARAKKTIFEKDLGVYCEFIEEIKSYLSAIKIVDKVALNRIDIREKLMDFIKLKASKKTKDIKQIRNIRDDIFNLLIKHGYLESLAQKSAGGSEAMHLSYIVGHQYDKASKDYYETEKVSPTEITVEPIELNSRENIHLKNLFQKPSQTDGLNPIKIKEILENEVSVSFSNLFQMDKYIKKNHRETALRIGSEIVKKFVINFFENFSKEFPEIMTKFKKLDNLINHLYNNNYFPFDTTEMRNYLRQTESFIQDEGGYDENHKVEKLYNLLSKFIGIMENFIDNN